MKHLFLCAQQRSGTNFFLKLLNCGPAPTRFNTLGEALYNKHVLKINEAFSSMIPGGPEEFLLAGRDRDKDREANPDFNLGHYSFELFNRYFQSKQTNGFISIKWFDFAMEILVSHLGGLNREIPEKLEARFGDIQYVRLIREDTWKQAISLYIAKKSNNWTSFHKTQVEINPETIPFDFETIRQYHDQFQNGNRWWDSFFESTGITPALTLTYEALCDDYTQQLARLSEAMGAPIYIPDASEIPIQKVAGEVNALFYQKVRDELKEKEAMF